jgi:hypothetical protein
MALKETTKEYLWIKAIIEQLPSYFTRLKGQKLDPGIVHTDSDSAIALAKNPVYHSRTKHIDIQYHFVRENVESRVLKLRYHPTESLVADGLTKAIPNPKFNQFVTDLRLQESKDVKDTL